MNCCAFRHSDVNLNLNYYQNKCYNRNLVQKFLVQRELKMINEIISRSRHFICCRVGRILLQSKFQTKITALLNGNRQYSLYYTM